MAATLLALVLADSVCRRIFLPLALLSAIIFRYNVFSLIYLLFFIIILFIPSPRLKSQKYVFLVLLVLLLTSSLLFLFGQTFFQFSLLTNSLLACSYLESLFRQIGVIQFRNIPVRDVLRLLMPDAVVVLTTMLSIVFNGLVMWKSKPRTVGGEDGGEQVVRRQRADSSDVDKDKSLTIQDHSPEEMEMRSISTDDHINDRFTQCYWHVPVFVTRLLELLIFLLLGLSGVAVPSLTSLTYFLSFLFILVTWSLHLRLMGVVRVLRLVLVFYGSAHLVILDLYQFQSAQELVPVEPSTTGTSLLVRLFGLTPVIWTVCSEPSSLHVFPGLHYINYMSPALILALVWLLATDCRLWLSTPFKLWQKYDRYFLPIQDHTHSPPFFIKMVKGDHHQGYEEHGRTEPPESASRELETLSRVKTAWRAIRQGLVSLWSLAISVSYVLAIVAMMVWSVAFPSWSSLVFLLWACGIWLFPKGTPREAVLWTSPLLVLYSTLLLLLQYVYSLDIGQDITRVNDLVPECSSGLEEGCKSWALAAKTGLTVIFYSAFHEFCRCFLKWRERERSRALNVSSGDRNNRASIKARNISSLESKDQGADSYEGLLQLIGTYWILAVVGAFLLVFLAGEPSLLKAVYLIFFFCLIVTYQVTKRWWFLINYPVWCALIVYAVVHLLLVYTYNFEKVREQWTELYDKTNLTVRNISESSLYKSIGLEIFDTTTDLITTLVPPAIFIAVLAAQIRFFKPGRRSVPSLVDLLPKSWVKLAKKEEMLESAREGGGGAVTESKLDQSVGKNESESKTEESPIVAGGEGQRGEEVNPRIHVEDGISEDTQKSQSLIQPADGTEQQNNNDDTTGTTSESPDLPKTSLWQNILIHLTKLLSFVVLKTLALVTALSLLTWRFLQLHLFRISMISLFAVSVSQISILYGLLLVGAVVLVPLSCLWQWTLPMMTLYLGAISLLKMVYQVPLILEEQFDFPEGSGYCDPVSLGNASGQVFHHRYSPQGSDAHWLGLHKAQDNFARYISLPIISALLLTLLFSVERFQEDFYKSKGVRVSKFEKGSLFLDVPRAKAEEAVWPAVKYWINHTFEIYGVEICLCMLAITVAVRVDVYGVFYTCALGIFLLVPRGSGKVWLMVWVAYMVVHGCLLIIQYFFLLGIPEDKSYCLAEEHVYIWSNLASVNHTLHPVALKKWLFLPADREQILNRNLLYADFLTYVMLSSQVIYFLVNPLKEKSSDHFKVKISLLDFTNSHNLLDYIKYFVFEYLFWVSLFLVFVTAVVRVSILGLVYLLAIFILLYRGEQMIKDSRKRRKLSWSLLRWFCWAVLSLRVSLQILSCCWTVLDSNECVLTLLFNGACTASHYFGATESDSCQATNVGLWVDAFNFAVITIQIVTMDTRYTDIISEDLREKEENATKLRDIFNCILKEKQELVQKSRHLELTDVLKRAESLDISGNKVDHILHRGVQLPEDIRLDEHAAKNTIQKKDKNYFQIYSTSKDCSTSAAPHSSESGKEEIDQWYSKAWSKVKAYLLMFVDYVTLRLENRSALYRRVVEKAAGSNEPTAHISDQAERKESMSLTLKASPNVDRYKVLPGTNEDGMGEITEVEDEDVRRKDSKDENTEQTEISLATTDFDHRAGLLGKHLPIQLSEENQKKADEYEKKLMDQAGFWTQRVSRLLIALYYMFLSHSEYVVYFFIIVNIILNGGMLSLIYAGLLFCWGLLSNPWPTRVFWLIIIFYSMLVIILKYTFQVVVVIVCNYQPEYFTDDEGGLSVYTVLGIQFHSNFLSNTAWDMVLLIALLIHRGLLKQYGLWTTYKRGASEVLANVKMFFKTLVDPNISLGAKDYYVVMLFFDLLCFITLVLGANSFGVGAADDVSAVASFVMSNSIPLFFLVMLLLQFLSMLIDRAIYLRHSVRGKLVFQVVLLVGWHVGLFYILPSTLVSDRPFVDNLAAQFLYFFKACYFIVSSLQIVSGYPVRVIGNFLTSSYNYISYGAFIVYRLIPLLPELREVMDWSFTDTTLSLFNWFRVQEIYAQLFLIKVRRDRESRSPRLLGKKQSWLIKIGLGLLLLAGLVALIWGPLVFISLLSSTSPPNPPTEVDVKLNLAGFEPLVQLTAQNISISTLNQKQYETLANYFQENSKDDVNVRPLFRQQLHIANFRHIKLKGTSTALWTISPPARDLLVRQLQDLRDNVDTSAVLSLTWSILRASQSLAVSEVVSGSRPENLKYKENNKTIEMFLDSLESSAGVNTTVFLQKLIPVVILAPADGASTIFTDLTDTLANDSRRFVSTKLKLASMSFDNLTREWWEMVQDNSTSPYILSEEGDKNNFIELIVYSSPAPPELFQSVAALGITGLYSVIVLAIGRLIRGIISDLPSRLIIDEILYPEPLLKLCDDIYLLRECKKFRLEEIYVGKLFNIFRSPEKIIELTEEPKVKTD